MKLPFLIGFHLGGKISDPIIPGLVFIGIWICLLCMKAASSSLVWRAETVSGNSLSSNYMRIIISAVDDSKQGILATSSPGFCCSSENLPSKWRALTRYVISLFLQLGHSFVCSAAGILACSLGFCQSAHWSTEAKQWSQCSKNADCTTVWEKFFLYSTHGKACYNVINPL